VSFLGRIFVVLFKGVIVDEATALTELSSNARLCEVALTRRGSDLRGWLEGTIWPMISTALTARGAGQQLDLCGVQSARFFAKVISPPFRIPRNKVVF